MALQEINGGMWTPVAEEIGHRVSDFQIDASGEKFAVIFEVPKTGTISILSFMTGAVANSQTLKIGLYTVDTTTGFPTTTAYGSMVAGTQAAPAANTFYSVTLSTPATATKGDIIAAVIEFNSTVGDVIFRVSNSTATEFPYVAQYLVSWTKFLRAPLLGIEYNDGSYEYNRCYASNTSAPIYTLNTTTTPDEIGNRFTLPFPATVSGVYLYCDVDAAVTIKLYDSTDTVLATISLNENLRGGTVVGFMLALFSTSIELSANTLYRITYLPTTTTSVNITYIGVVTAAAMDTLPMGQNMYYTARTNAGAWTDDTLKRVIITPYISHFSDGTGGASMKVHPGMSGGLNG